METFIANLKRAVRNHETVSIGGGDFTPSELNAVLQHHKATTEALQVAASMIADLVNGYMVRDLCESPAAFNKRLDALKIERE